MALVESHFSALQWPSQASASGYSNSTIVDKVPPSMLYLVDAHWYQFAPINPLWYSILGFTICCLAFTAIVGNSVVMYIFTTTKSLRTPSNLLVVNLAFSDFLMMFTMAPPFVINCYFETWIFGPMMCQIYGSLGSLFGTASIWTMTAIAYDRYHVIVKGISGKPMTINSAIFLIFLVWASSILWVVFPFFGWSRYVPEGMMTACGTDYLSKDWITKSYILLYGVFCYYAPLFLIVYSYYFIIQTVSAHEKNMREQAKKMNVASLRTSEVANTSAECKLAKVALVTITLWFMAWTPYLIINYEGFFETATISPLTTIWGSLFAKANAVYNPIVYGISHPKYRAALYKRFPALACRESNDDSQSVISGQSAVSEDKVPSA